MVPLFIETTHAGHGGPDIADFIGRYAAAASQQAIAEFGQIVAVGRSQPDASNHDPITLLDPCNHCRISLKAMGIRDLSSPLEAPQ